MFFKFVYIFCIMIFFVDKMFFRIDLRVFVCDVLMFLVGVLSVLVMLYFGVEMSFEIFNVLVILKIDV